MKSSTTGSVLLGACSFLLFVAALWADPLDYWQWRPPLYQGNPLTHATYGNGLFVAVGTVGTVVVSADSTNWTVALTPKTTNTLNEVAFGNGRFVAVGDSGYIVTSPDGIHWTSASSGTSAKLYSVAFGGGEFVAVGSAGTILRTVDGVTWTWENSGTLSLLTSVAFGNGVFAVIESNGYVLTSSPSGGWTRTYVGLSLYSIACFRGTFFAIGFHGIYSSTEGIIWISRQFGVYDSSAKLFAGEAFLQALPSTPRARIISTDGITWSQLPYSPFVPAASGDGKFMALRGSVIYASRDAINWTPVPQPSVAPGGAVTYADNKFVSVASSGASISTNGIEWQTMSIGAYLPLYSITYSVGRYIAVGQQFIFTSTNGSDWMTASIPQTDTFMSVAFGNNHFAVVGRYGSILTSPDGMDWTSRRESSDSSFLGLTGVAFGAERFVSVGGNGLMLVSTNGIEWATNSIGTTNSFKGVSFVNARFIAGDESGNTYISSNGVTWSVRPRGPEGSPSGNGILFREGIYYAPVQTDVDAGAQTPGRVLTSTNGEDWQALYTGTAVSPYSLATDGKSLVAAGNNVVIQSDPFEPTAPSIIAQPQNRAASEGATAIFSVVAYASSPFKYQWFKDGTALAGATNSVLALAAVNASNAGAYSVFVSNSISSAMSDTATLTVVSASPPVITSQPNGSNVLSGRIVILAVQASGSAPLYYQWLKDGIPLLEATNSVLVFAPARYLDAGSYTVQISNALGQATSEVATLVVNLPTDPFIEIPPAGATVTIGSAVTLSVTAAGTPPLHFQWHRNNVPIAGANSSTLSIASVRTNDNGLYSVVVSNAIGTASSAATLTAVDDPGIDAQPFDLTAARGATVQFAAYLYGTTPIQWQWFKNGQPIAGEAGIRLGLLSVRPEDAGTYTLAASNRYGGVVSRPATLAVVEPNSLDHWHVVGQLPTSNSWSVFGYLNGAFYVSGNGPLAFSDDGTNWMQSVLDESSPLYIYDMTFGEGKYVAAGPAGMFASSNRVEWSAGVAPPGADLRAVAYGNGRFMAVGNQVILTSTNGFDWVPRSLAKPDTLSDVVYGNGLFVAVGDRTIQSSSDGQLWVNRLEGVMGNPSFSSVAYGNGRFVAVGRAYRREVAFGTYGMSFTSTNGIDWSGGDPILYDSLAKVSYGGGLFLAVPPYYIWNGISHTPGFSSQAGRFWVLRRLAGNPSNPVLLTGGLVAFGNGAFLAVDQNQTLWASDPIVQLGIRLSNSPELALFGPLGSTCQIEASGSIGVRASWNPMLTLEITNSVMFWRDTQATNGTSRFYRATVLPKDD